MQEILVSGSTAFDTLMHYNGKFSNQFVDTDVLSWLNMSIVSDSCEKNLGWTGANIAYNCFIMRKSYFTHLYRSWL